MPVADFVKPFAKFFFTRTLVQSCQGPKARSRTAPTKVSLSPVHLPHHPNAC